MLELMANYIPFPAHHDMAPIDISYLFESEKPAGKHGFCKARGDRFVFEDGTPVRFWGTNLNSGACFPEHDYAEKLAKRLAAYGCNIVRLHQMDAEWALPNIYQYRRGKRLGDTSTYDPESFDRLDYFVSCLKKEGVYIYLDMLTYRKFKEADGVRNSVALINRAAPYGLFDERLIQLQKEYCNAIWNHYNPYTGLCYKDDPVFALGDVANEIDLFGAFNHKIVVEPYASEFRESFRLWCEANGKTTDAATVDLNSLENDDLNDYKIEVCQKFYDGMIDYMHGLGVKIPLTGINFSWRFLPCKAAQRSGDFNDSHLNVRFIRWDPFKIPAERASRDISLHELPEWGAFRNARMRHFGKPFFTSEWDLTWPNRYRAESSIMMAATGMLQNWSGYTIHTYAYTSLLQDMHMLGKETSTCSIGGTGYREGIMSTWNDPAKFGLFYHAAIITRREDVSPAKNKYTVKVEQLQCNDYGTFLPRPDRKSFITSTELSQIGSDYYGDYPDAIHDQIPLVDQSKGEVTSDTGEMYRSWVKRYGTIDTPMTKAAYGMLGKNEPIELNGLRIACQSEYAVIAMSSLNNDLDIGHSDSILLTTVGQAENTGMKWVKAPDAVQRNDGFAPYMQLEDMGHPPIIAEVIEADIELTTDRSNMVVWAISAEGLLMGNVPTVYEDGKLKFTLGKKYASIYYLIQAE